MQIGGDIPLDSRVVLGEGRNENSIFRSAKKVVFFSRLRNASETSPSGFSLPGKVSQEELAAHCAAVQPLPLYASLRGSSLPKVFVCLSLAVFCHLSGFGAFVVSPQAVFTFWIFSSKMFNFPSLYMVSGALVFWLDQ